jgi:hypothetical protein
MSTPAAPHPPLRTGWQPDPSGSGFRWSDGSQLVGPTRPSPPHTPIVEWVALLLSLGPVWWIVVPYLVNRYLVPLPENGILIGPVLALVTSTAGFVLALATIGTASRSHAPVGADRASIVLFAGFCLFFAAAFIAFVVSFPTIGR